MNTVIVMLDKEAIVTVKEAVGEMRWCTYPWMISRP